QRLERAGRRALARSDLPAAIRLLERASSPRLVDEATRARLLPELGAALIGTGTREAEAEEALVEARRLAAASRDEGADAHAVVQQEILRVYRAEEGGTEEAAHVLDRVIPVFEQFGDEHGLCRAWRLRGFLYWHAARAAAAIDALEQAAAHARRAGDEEER